MVPCCASTAICPDCADRVVEGYPPLDRHRIDREGCARRKPDTRRGNWLRGRDLNPRPSGYEPDELPGCSTPRRNRNMPDRAAGCNAKTQTIERLLVRPTIFGDDDRADSCRDGELVRSGLCRVLVSEENARGRSPRLVRGTFRYGRVKLVILFSPGCIDGAPLVPEHTGQLRLQRQTASIALASFHARKISSGRDDKKVAPGQKRQGRTHTGSGTRDDHRVHARARGFAAR